MRYTNELLDKLDEFNEFAGVYARDELPSNIGWPMGLIVNTDLSSQPGTHWIAIYIDSEGNGEYFDSYGFQPNFVSFRNYLKNNCIKYFYNPISLQCFTCVTCGEYCVAYLCSRFIGLSYFDFINLFTKNPHKNDIIVKSLFNSID